MNKKQYTQILLWLAASAVFILAGCGKPGAGGDSGGFAVPVVAVEVQRRPVAEALSLVGSISANEQVEIKPEIDGTVQEILFSEGQRADKGDLLVRLDDSKLAAAVAEAESNFRLSQANFERAKNLFKDNMISPQEYDQAAAAHDLNQATLELRKRQWKDTQVFAPFAGVLGARNVSPGQVITKDTALTTLVDLDPVKVEINVPERFLSQVREGQTIEVGVAAFPGHKFAGRVYFIAPLVDSATRTALVKAQIPNADHALKPGMFANLDLTLKVRDHAVVVPESAVQLQDTQASVFLVGADNVVQQRPVTLGQHMPGCVEITQGLNGGENVITEGVQKVGPGAKVVVSSAPTREAGK
jgi:membrane fusion protein, multidrug efflux system